MQNKNGHTPKHNLREIDLVVLSHLRWGFVYQRPQHLLSRFARHQRVFFVEEPMYGAETPSMEIRQCPESGVHIAIPQLQHGLNDETQNTVLRLLITYLLRDHGVSRYMTWYYTPMALGFTQHLKPEFTIYDCMDELALFAGAPPALREREQELFRRANVVFTGGQSLYESKCLQHGDVHAFPSSVDVPHFAQARTLASDPADQAHIPHPRFGFCGVIDERMNIDLLRGVAAARPNWHFAMIGPIVKIDPAHLPQAPNIHYLGGKSYKELPAYMSGWDVAFLPFAHNDSTRFISPTKTPEYLAAGLPTISTSIRDVVRPYGEKNYVHIADTVDEFVRAGEAALRQKEDAAWHARVDNMLSQISWDLTWARMVDVIGSRMMPQPKQQRRVRPLVAAD